MNEKGQVIAQATFLKEMETEIEEESGLKCCICLEGYKNQPEKVLCAWCAVTMAVDSVLP